MVSGIENNASAVNTALSSVANDTNTSANAAKNAESAAEQKSTGEVKDVLELGKSSKNSNGTYSKITPERQAIIDKLKNESEARINSFKQLVEKVITKQGQTFNDYFGDVFNSNSSVTNFKDMLAGLNVDSQTKLQAQQAIGEDGEYGVQKTSERILDFAKALIGDDMSKFGKIKDAIIGGFKAAERVWGGQLPEISKKTYDTIMSKLNEWEKNGSTSSDISSEVLQQAAVETISK